MTTYSLITTIDEAEKAWNLLSPNEEIFDDWTFRYIYFEFIQPDIYFYAAYENEELVGLLPLQWNKELGYLEFFGGQFMGYNSIFVKIGHESCREDLIRQIKKPAYLRWMRESLSPVGYEETVSNTYYLPLAGLANTDDYLNTYWKNNKSKKEFKRQMRRTLEREIEITHNNFSDLDQLIEFNKQKFGAESVFHIPYRSEFFKEIIKRFECHMISISIDGIKEGIAFRIAYNGILYGINAGLKEGSKNIGKLLYLQTIDLGIKLKIKKYDALDGAYGWKEDFGFLPRPQYHLDLRHNK